MSPMRNDADVYARVRVSVSMCALRVHLCVCVCLYASRIGTQVTPRTRTNSVHDETEGRARTES